MWRVGVWTCGIARACAYAYRVRVREEEGVSSCDIAKHNELMKKERVVHSRTDVLNAYSV